MPLTPGLSLFGSRSVPRSFKRFISSPTELLHFIRLPYLRHNPPPSYPEASLVPRNAGKWFKWSIRTLFNVPFFPQPPVRVSFAKSLFRTKASLRVQPARNIMLIERLSSRKASRQRVPHLLMDGQAPFRAAVLWYGYYTPPLACVDSRSVEREFA